MRPGLGPGGYFHPSASAVPRSLQQHSIESSVVTEGHYDASFETEDQAASFDVDPGANYIYLEAAGPPPTLLSNGHFKMCPQELSMLGIDQVELETKAIRRFAKILQSRRRPLLIIASASQFHVYLPWGKYPFSIVS